MPRRSRALQVVPGNPHHLILRGNNRRRLFSYPSEYRLFLFRMIEASQKHAVPVHTATQMTNHIHLIATAEEHKQLARFVKHFAQTYAQSRNRRRRASGKLFEERYRCIPIMSEKQMAITAAYIELNPVRAGVSEEASGYRWSTFKVHAGFGASDPLIEELWKPSGWYLSLGAAPAERASAYLDWFEHYRARDDWSKVYADPGNPNDRRRVERPDRRTAT
jgi:putative transposase